MFLNEVFYKNKSETWSNSLKLSTDFTRWLTAEYTGSLSQRTHKTALRQDTKITTQNHEFGLYVYPADVHTIRLSGEWLRTRLRNEVREDFFGDIIYRSTLSVKEIDI